MTPGQASAAGGAVAAPVPLTGRYAAQGVQLLAGLEAPSADRFAWMKDATGRSNVFITFIVGGGIILSGIAWVVDKVASKTSTPEGEERIAAELGNISYPRGGLIVDDVTVLAQEVPGADDAQIRKLLRRAGH